MKWLYKQVFCLEKVIAQDLQLMGQFYKKLLFSLIFYMHGSLRGDNLWKDNSLAASAAGKLFWKWHLQNTISFHFYLFVFREVVILG